MNKSTITAAVLTAAVACAAPSFAQQTPAQPGGMQGDTQDRMNDGMSGMKNDMKNDMKQDMKDMKDGMSQMSPEMQKKMDKMFVEAAGHGNAYEIAAGKMAQEKAQDPQIKQMGQMLATDHQAAQDKLKQAAQQAGFEVPSEPSAPQKAALEAMRELDGKMFDKAFLYDQVGDHRTDILTYTDASNHCSSPQVKQYAQSILPKLKEHATKAEQMAEKMAGESMGMSSGRMGMNDAGMDDTGMQNDDARPAAGQIGGPGAANLNPGASADDTAAPQQ